MFIRIYCISTKCQSPPLNRKEKPYGRELWRNKWSYSSVTLPFAGQLHCFPKQFTAPPALLTEVGREAELKWQWWGEGQRKVKGEGRTGNELERDHERQKRRERLREREGAAPRATAALPPRSHPCVTSPCCKLGYTCSPEMSEHISWCLAWICIGALQWYFFSKGYYFLLHGGPWTF